MNQSNILLFESKWKSFLKESTNSDVTKKDDYGIDDLLNSMGFSDEEEKNDILENNVELISREFAYSFAKRALNKLYEYGILDNTPLTTIKLKKLLGIGAYAVAFEDQDGHVIKCGEVRTENSTDKEFYQKYLKKPSKNFVVHYYKTFQLPKSMEMYLTITNKFLTFTEYSQFKVDSKSNQNILSIVARGYYEFLTDITSEIDVIRKELVRTLPKTRDSFPTRNLTFPMIYKILSQKKPDLIKNFYQRLDDCGLQPKDSYKILTEIIKVYCTQSKPDISLNNLGVNITAGMDNPGFFFFDQ